MAINIRTVSLWKLKGRKIRTAFEEVVPFLRKMVFNNVKPQSEPSVVVRS